MIATLGNFATKRITGSPAGITRCAGTPQVHELAGRTLFVYPLLHPAAALRTPSVAETPAPGLRQPAGAARGAAARRRPTPSPRSWSPNSPRGPTPSRPRPRSRQPARPVRLVSNAIEEISDSAAETEALGARLAVGSRGRASRARLRRGRRRQVDLHAWRLPGAGRHRAGPVADLHDRPPPLGPGAGLAPRPLPARRSRPRGPGAARRLPDRRRGRVRGVARDRGGRTARRRRARRPPGHAPPPGGRPPLGRDQLP